LLAACVKPVDWLSRAQFEFEQADYLGAIVALNALLENGDSSCKAMHLRASCFRRIGKWKLAANDLLSAQANWPECTEAQLELARVLSDSGDTAAAHRQLIRLQNISGALGAEIQTELALLSYKQDRFHSALEHLNQAVARDSGSHLVWYYRGYLRSRFTDDDHSAGTRIMELFDFDSALSDFSRCIAIDSNFADSWYQRGMVYLNQFNRRKGLHDVERAIQLEPDFSYYYTGRAEYYMREEDFISAKIDLQKAIAINPNDSLNKVLLKRANEAISSQSAKEAL
jgi:tetratricopeptide (TPR) repeat protein